jgi:hypothetical protein
MISAYVFDMLNWFGAAVTRNGTEIGVQVYTLAF